MKGKKMFVKIQKLVHNQQCAWVKLEMWSLLEHPEPFPIMCTGAPKTLQVARCLRFNVLKCEIIESLLGHCRAKVFFYSSQRRKGLFSWSRGNAKSHCYLRSTGNPCGTVESC